MFHRCMAPIALPYSEGAFPFVLALGSVSSGLSVQALLNRERRYCSAGLIPPEMFLLEKPSF